MNLIPYTGVEIIAGNQKLPESFADFPIEKCKKLQA